MKKLIRKILWGNHEIREYVTVKTGSLIDETVFLRTKELLINISPSHSILSLEPVVMGVWIESPYLPIDESQVFQIEFKSGKKVLAKMKLTFFHKVREANGTLFLLQVVECSIYQNNWLTRTSLYRWQFRKLQPSFMKFKSLAAAYSYPRKVKIISFRDDAYYNIFPMDLLGKVNHDRYFVFGLRHTNIALSKIIQSKKILVAETSSQHKNEIYQLGKHHGTQPPPVEQLPFRVSTSQQFGFYLPEWVDSYQEIEITQTIDLGSHMLLWGRVINSVEHQPNNEELAHIHFLYYLYQAKKGIDYPLA